MTDTIFPTDLDQCEMCGEHATPSDPVGCLCGSRPLTVLCQDCHWHACDDATGCWG